MGWIEFSLAVAAPLLAALMLVVFSRFTGLIWSRAVRKFWKGFRNNAVVMTTEYVIGADDDSGLSDEIVSTTSDQAVALTATSGFFISYGMALSLTQLIWHFRRVLRCDVPVFGDKGHAHPREDRSLVVLGSPLNNRYLASFRSDFARECPALEHFKWELTANGVSLVLPDGEVLVPNVDEEESGIDWALVAHFALDPAKGARIIMISGCNMWATEGATRFVTDRKSLRRLPRSARNPARPAAFVLRIRVAHGNCDRVEIYSKSQRPLVFPLAERDRRRLFRRGRRLRTSA